MEAVGFAAGYLPLPDASRSARRSVCSPDGTASATTARRSSEALERFGIGHLADRLVRRCRAAAHTRRHRQGDAARPGPTRPRRPTASLDPDIALKVRSGLLEHCARTGAALLVTTTTSARSRCSRSG